MTSLVACLSTGKGTWAHVNEIINKEDWDKIFLVTNDFGVQNFKPSKQVEYILVDTTRFLTDIVMDIKKQLEGKISDFEVAVNLVSGEGKEHMAIISALMKLGLGIRLIALTQKGIEEI